MKVLIQKKGDQAATEVSLADLLLNVGTVTDRDENKTIKINGEIYLLDTIEDIQKGEVKTESNAPEDSEPASNSEAESSATSQVQP